jgi:cobalt-zinc-cadmium efflux system protein
MTGHGEHCHDHAHGGFGRLGAAFALGTALNLGFVAVEAACGVIAGSMALLADAGHNLGDVLGLVAAWSAAMLSRRRPSAHYTYGLRSSSILAALFNAIFLLVTVGGIAWEALRRIAEPEPVEGGVVVVVAALGIAVNGATALLFARGRHDDLNIRGAFLHMAADAALSLGVVVSGLVVLLTGASWIDPLASLAVVAFIVAGTWGLLRDALRLSMDAVPPGIDPAEVRLHLEALGGVARIHDLHIWAMSTTETALTCHLVMPGGHPGDAFTAVLARDLHDRFGIEHVTVQIETDPTSACVLEPDHVV